MRTTGFKTPPEFPKAQPIKIFPFVSERERDRQTDLGEEETTDCV